MTETLDSLRVSIPKDQIVALERYTWPGNVRELRNVIERAVKRPPVFGGHPVSGGSAAAIAHGVRPWATAMRSSPGANRGQRSGLRPEALLA